MHMTGVAALGSQLMPLTVESVYKNVYFGISLDQRTCELAYPRFATNPVYVVCLYACVVCVECTCAVHVWVSHLAVQ